MDVTYSVNEDDVILIENNKVTAVNPGNVVVIAKNGNDVLKKYVITVKDDFTSIEIFGDNYLIIGDSSTYYAQIKPDKLSQEVIWSSSDEEVIKIDEEGNAKAIGEGLAQIVARSKEHPTYSSSINVLVTEKYIDKNSEEYSDATEELSGSLLESIFYPIIEDSKSYVIGVNGFKSNNIGIETASTPASGIVYKRQYVLKSGEVVDEVETLDDVRCYKYYAITNRHVVKGMKRITVTDLETDLEIDASLVQYDLKVDLAVITFETGIYYKCAKFGDSDEVKSGDFVIAIGSPTSYNYKNTATIGIVSSTIRYLSDDTDGDEISDWDARYIQHDASINDGNNGGPLINLKGEVIGLNTLKISSVKTEDMGFAIPSNTFVELIDLLENGVQIVRPILGITAAEIKAILVSEYTMSQYNIPEGVTYGIYVSTVDEGVAKKAGVLPDDIIIQINGVNIYHTYILRAELGKFIVGSGEEYELVIIRDGQEITLTVIF